MTKWIKTVDGIVDTISIERPGHFEAETYQEEVSREVSVLDAEGNPVIDENGQPVTETVNVMEGRQRQVFVPDETFVEGTDDVFAGFAFDGKKYTAPAPPPPTFEPLTPPQFHAMIAISGKKAEIASAINAMPDPAQKAVALAYFEYSTLYHRESPLFSRLAPLVGLSDKEVDALWTQASQIKV